MLFISFLAVLLFNTWFSYILTEPNLVLTTHPLYWNFQLNLWEKYYSNSDFITISYSFIALALFFLYLLIYFKLKKKKTLFKFNFKSKYLWFYLLVLGIISLSYNALSHDIYNYMFNAKLVVQYGLDPHLVKPIDFAQKDEWVRFMHNIGTESPYGYAWTALSLIPYLFGMNKFILTLISFKVFTIIGVLLLYFAVQHMSNTMNKRNLYLHELALLFLNPLLLFEAVANFHNDFWMMIPAVWSVSMVIRLMQPTMMKKETNRKALYFVSALALLIISIFIKVATIVILPLFIYAFVYVFFVEKYSELIKKKFKLPIPTNFISGGLSFFTQWIHKYIPTLVSVALFLPLLTPRSRYFLPWYFLWVIVWIPFIKNKMLKKVFVLFSLSSLLRYIPWLYNGFNYSEEILRDQKIITWIIPVIYLFTNLRHFPKKKKQTTQSNLKKIC